MSKRSLLGGLWMVLAGLALVGCESSVPYYAPAYRTSGFASGPMAQGANAPSYSPSAPAAPNYPPRVLPPAEPAGQQSRMEFPAERTPAAMEQSTAFNSGATATIVTAGATADSSTPMVTISLPPVKLQVPLTSLYSIAPATRTGATAPTMEAQPAPRVQISSPAPVENQPVRQAAPNVSMSIQPAGAMNPYAQQPAPQSIMPTRTYNEMTQNQVYLPPAAPPMQAAAVPMQEPMPAPRPSLIGPPPPSWTRSTSSVPDSSWPRATTSVSDSNITVTNPATSSPSMSPMLPAPQEPEPETMAPTLPPPPPAWPQSAGSAAETTSSELMVPVTPFRRNPNGTQGFPSQRSTNYQ